MRLVEQHPTIGDGALRPRRERIEALESWLSEEIEDAISARYPQERRWTDALKMYEAIPAEPIRDTPIEGAKMIEIPLGAISADAIYAQAIDTIFSASPVLTARAVEGSKVKGAQGLQRLVDWSVANELNFRAAGEESILDDVQLGTGILYIPWVESVKRTRTARITARHPRIFSVAPENFFVCGGADADLQWTPWCSMRTWLTESEYQDRVRLRGWKDEAQKVGMIDWVRSERERLGRTSSSRRISFLYEIHHVYCHYDIDGDGLDEDLLLVWDRSSRRVLKHSYNPFDRRPFAAMRYQLRPHLFYGIGVLDMVRPFEEEATEVHFHRLLNMLLANSRIFTGPPGAQSDLTRIYPGKFIPQSQPGEISAIQLADVYPSSFQGEAIPISMAERRVGLNDMATPRASQVLGSRTPGITALSMIQQVNRRFAPAFDGMKFALADAARHGLYRYQERLLAGDPELESHVARLLGDEARDTIGLLRSSEFDEAVEVELTAASASVNREADRQSYIGLMNVMLPYYERSLQLAAVAVSPQTPPPIREVAGKIAGAAAKLVERTLRTFDQIRDPKSFVIEFENQLDQEVGPMPADDLSGLQGILSQIGVRGA
jgi:hypothetical protein